MAALPSNEWDKVANSYDTLQGDQGDPYRRLVIDPVIFDVIGDITGQTVFDAGCGNGYLANQLKLKGGRVSAFDSSAGLVEHARQRFTEIDFQQADFLKVLPYPDQFFDVIISHFVFQDLADLTLPLAECRRMLKPDGRLIISVTHPCFAYPTTKPAPTLLDRLFRRPPNLIVNEYQTEGPIRAVVPGLSTTTTRYHRRLSTYLRGFRESGWMIRTLAEPLEIINPQPADQEALKTWPLPGAYVPVFLTAQRGIPFVLIFELQPVIQPEMA